MCMLKNRLEICSGQAWIYRDLKAVRRGEEGGNGWLRKLWHCSIHSAGEEQSAAYSKYITFLPFLKQKSLNQVLLMPSGHHHEGFWAYRSPGWVRRIAAFCGLFTWGFIQLISFLSCYKITHSSSKMSNEKRSSVSDSSHAVLRELIGVVITLNTSIQSRFYDELKKSKCCFK